MTWRGKRDPVETAKQILVVREALSEIRRVRCQSIPTVDKLVEKLLAIIVKMKEGSTMSQPLTKQVRSGFCEPINS